MDGEGKHQAGSCTCITEQGTAYDLSQPECRTLARYGPVYNPYRERHDNRPQMQPEQAQQPQQIAGQGGAPTLEGSVIGKQIRALGSFPESEPYKTSTKAADTTREL